MFKIININKNSRTQELITQLLEVWESSVRATHIFLSESEIDKIKQYVPIAIKDVEVLTVAISNTTNSLIAFMGIEKHKLEMLFVRANERGKGIGTKLLKYGLCKYSINELRVNEQNPHAIKFYENNGFCIYNRSEIDEQGNPYPILFMKPYNLEK